MPREPEKIVFAATLTRITGDGEQVSVNFKAADKGELRTRLGQAGDVIAERVKKHNDKVIDLSEELEQQTERVRANIERAERKRLADAGLIPHDLVGVSTRDPKEANGGADPAGAAHLRADS